VADAVLICTQDALHAEPAVAFAELGYHVLLEKPMATTEADCRRIVGAVERAGAILWLRYVVGRPIRRVASFGSLTHFRPENRPAGAADRCLDCGVEPADPRAAAAATPAAWVLAALCHHRDRPGVPR
jgi:Oxidoreductase family, NAD-binding Rossmann fold